MKHISSKKMVLTLTNLQAFYLSVLLKKIPMEEDKTKIIIDNITTQIDKNFINMPSIELYDFENEMLS